MSHSHQIYLGCKLSFLCNAYISAWAKEKSNRVKLSIFFSFGVWNIIHARYIQEFRFRFIAWGRDRKCRWNFMSVRYTYSSLHGKEYSIHAQWAKTWKEFNFKCVFGLKSMVFCKFFLHSESLSETLHSNFFSKNVDFSVSGNPAKMDFFCIYSSLCNTAILIL